MQGDDGLEANAVNEAHLHTKAIRSRSRISGSGGKKEEMSAGAYRGKAKAGSGRDGGRAAAFIGAR